MNLVSKLTPVLEAQIKELGSRGMRGKAIVDALGIDIHPSNINKFLARSGITTTGEVAELSLAEMRREQMENLFKDYVKSEPIVYDTLPDGVRIVVLSDFQIPFEEQWLLGCTRGKDGAIEKALRDYQPQIIILNGDIMDCYAISTFDKSPSRRFNLNTEKELTIKALSYLREICPVADIIFVEGNHEDRLGRTLAAICQKDIRAFELFGATGYLDLTTKNLLHLDDLGIDWQPYRGWVDVLGFVVTHGDLLGPESGDTAKKMQKKWQSSGVNGHTHRLGAYFHTDATGKTHAWYEGGCLCRLDLEYVMNPDWQQGFLVGQVANGLLHTQLITVFDNTFLLDGQVYKA